VLLFLYATPQKKKVKISRESEFRNEIKS
jgi:hypothetical protein